MKTLKILLLLLVSLLFMACPQSDDDITIEPQMNFRIENVGADTIETLKIETVDQTITLNQFASNLPTNYYLISNLNAGNIINITIENSSNTSIMTQNTFGAIGNYKLDVSATSDLTTFSVSLNPDL